MELALTTHSSDFLSIYYLSSPVALGHIILCHKISHDCKLWEDKDMCTVWFVCQTESTILWGT